MFRTVILWCTGNIPQFVVQPHVSLCVVLLQEELRPEYEEVLQGKKAKLKGQSKKKVFFLLFQIYDLQHKLIYCSNSVCTMILLQLPKAEDEVDGETDQMLASQVSLRCSV